MPRRALVPTLLLLAGIGTAAPPLPGLALQDGFGPWNNRLPPLLERLHEQGVDTTIPLSHVEPSPSAPPQGGCLTLEDSVSGKRLSVSCLAGVFAEGAGPRRSSGLEIGGIAQGSTRELAFRVDARIHSLRQEPTPYSPDGQFIELQKEGADSRVSYTSFSRFEAQAVWESGLGRLSGGRGRQHWGPAYDHPLVLGQWTTPYPYLDWTLTLGAFQVRSLWASLASDGTGGMFRKDSTKRILYGHRYEWTPRPWVAVGASELLLLHDQQEPLAFLPFVPLFMEKGQTLEDRNNGELAFDVDLRPLRGWRVYGEFLIDDMSEPTSLFNDLWKNRWAWTVGTHLAVDPCSGSRAGLILEASRVEPWVYTHYQWSTVQAAHQGILLGNPHGPNSFAGSSRAYVRWKNLTVGTMAEVVWKGRDSGSRWQDTLSDNETTRKAFLGGGIDRSLEWSADAALAIPHGTLRVATTLPWGARDPERARTPPRWALRLEGML